MGDVIQLLKNLQDWLCMLGSKRVAGIVIGDVPGKAPPALLRAYDLVWFRRREHKPHLLLTSQAECSE